MTKGRRGRLSDDEKVRCRLCHAEYVWRDHGHVDHIIIIVIIIIIIATAVITFTIISSIVCMEEPCSCRWGSLPAAL